MGAWRKGYCRRACHLRIKCPQLAVWPHYEGMTLEQCYAVHCNSQQVEGSAGWDRHSSDDLRNRQVDGQDEEGRRVYNQRDLSNGGDDNSEDTRKL